jgi:hypothetical protein
MKITFDDKSFAEIKKSHTSDKIIFTIGALDGQSKRVSIINSVELTQEQFDQLIKLQ